MKTFKEYLQGLHSDHYKGTDDDMPDKFDLWMERLNIDDWLGFGQAYGTYITQETIKLINKI